MSQVRMDGRHTSKFPVNPLITFISALLPSTTVVALKRLALYPERGWGKHSWRLWKGRFFSVSLPLHKESPWFSDLVTCTKLLAHWGEKVAGRLLSEGLLSDPPPPTNFPAPSSTLSYSVSVLSATPLLFTTLTSSVGCCWCIRKGSSILVMLHHSAPWSMFISALEWALQSFSSSRHQWNVRPNETQWDPLVVRPNRIGLLVSYFKFWWQA